MKKAGMILEGGGQRGIFTSGVLDYLMEKKVELPYVIGVSAGARAMQLITFPIRSSGTKECMLDAQLDNELYGVKTLMHTKYFMNMDLIFDEFPNHLYPFDYEAYVKSPTQLPAGGRRTASPERRNIIEEYREPSAKMMHDLPGILQPAVRCADGKDLDGVPMLDGGIADSIPVRKAIADGFDHNIVILTRHEKVTIRKSSTDAVDPDGKAIWYRPLSRRS